MKNYIKASHGNIYVYMRHIHTGKEDFINVYYDWKDAINKIRQCYNADNNCGLAGEYYYFAKER